MLQLEKNPQDSESLSGLTHPTPICAAKFRHLPEADWWLPELEDPFPAMSSFNPKACAPPLLANFQDKRDTMEAVARRLPQVKMADHPRQ